MPIALIVLLAQSPDAPRFQTVTVYNSAFAFSLNDGALWAGRGWNQLVRAGVRARWGRVTFMLAPELVSSENRAYAVPSTRPYSIDLPERFGARGFTRLEPGQSTLALDLGAVTVGASTANEWWGPGIRNAIVLSNNAPGIWRGFVRWRRGNFAARWFLGGLFESPYFDTSAANDRRAISAAQVTWSTPTLTLGAARAVYAPLGAWSNIGSHAFDIARGGPGRDQVFSLFGRWSFPADGFAVHGEWARYRLPGSLRELLVSPNHTQGYTLGLEWERGAVHTEAELTYLQKSPAYRNLPEQTWYAGGAAPQGYTQRGQAIGASIGPGASSQWVAGDYVSGRWRAGLFAGRIRWDDDALFMLADSTEPRLRHDVSLFVGVRGQWRQVGGSVTVGRRLNPFYETDKTRTTTTLELRFTP